MLKHVVFFKFRKDADPTAITEVQKGLKALPGTISEIREFQLGLDIIHSERSYDMALISSFDDLDSMKRYQVHPAHMAQVEKLKKICDGILAVDFEF